VDRTRVGARAGCLVAAVLLLACVPSEPPAGTADDGTSPDVASDPSRDGAGADDLSLPGDARDATADTATSDSGTDPAGDPGASDPGAWDVGPADLPADPGVDEDASFTIQCRPGQVTFPDFDRACEQDAECALAFHQKDCCGSISVMGIRADLLADFQAAEAVCSAQWPACGCASAIPTADDGTSSGNLDDFGVRCDSGQCRSTVAAGTCGDSATPGDDCDAVQARLDGLRADANALSCVVDEDCAGTSVMFTPFCTTECACAVVTNVAASTCVQSLATRWQDLGCPIEYCSCTRCATVLRCVEGVCKGRL
jgi:hypothetical protein